MDIRLTTEEIDRLIGTPKKIVQGPSKEDRLEGQFYRNDMRLVSADEQHGFKVFFRRHKIFIENFSIGLIYSPHDISGSIVLFRCNGIHGSTKRWEHHKSAHIHRSTEQGLLENRKIEGSLKNRG